MEDAEKRGIKISDEKHSMQTRREFLRTAALATLSAYSLLQSPLQLLAKDAEDNLEQRVIDYVRENQQDPLEFMCRFYEKPSVVLLGESHDDARQRRFMAGLIPRLKKKGVSYAGLEIEQEYQDVINDYLRGKSVPLGRYLRGTLGNQSYIAILDAMRAARMNALCIDVSEGEYDRWNYLMAKNIVDFLKRNDTKIIVYMGEFHIRKATTERLSSSVGKFLSKDLKGREVFSIAQESYKPGRRGFETLVEMVGPTLDRAVAVTTERDPIKDLPYSFHPVQTKYGETFDGVILHP